jgi:hypothetical protein
MTLRIQKLLMKAQKKTVQTLLQLNLRQIQRMALLLQKRL